MLNTFQECALAIKTGDYPDEILKAKINMVCNWDSDNLQAIKSKFQSIGLPTEDINLQGIMEIQFEDNASALAFKPCLEEIFQVEDIQKWGEFKILEPIGNILYVNLILGEYTKEGALFLEETCNKLQNFQNKRMNLSLNIGTLNPVDLLLDKNISPLSKLLEGFKIDLKFKIEKGLFKNIYDIIKDMEIIPKDQSEIQAFFKFLDCLSFIRGELSLAGGEGVLKNLFIGSIHNILKKISSEIIEGLKELKIKEILAKAKGVHFIIPIGKILSFEFDIQVPGVIVGLEKFIE